MPDPTKNIPDTTRNNTDYSTDLTDAQWEIIAAVLPPPDTSGRPPKTNLRHAINAMFYRLKTGCQWAMLPRDFGIPPRTVLFWFAKFAKLGIWQTLQEALVGPTREACGRAAQPEVLIVDSQTVKSAETAKNTGCDGGQKLKGRKRHVVVDVLGLVLAVVITSAGVTDAKAAEAVLDRPIIRDNTRLKTLLADFGYRRDELDAFLAKRPVRYRLQMTSRPDGPGFVVIRQRWIVERTHSWLRSCRLLARDYERYESSSLANADMRSVLLTLNKYQSAQAKLAVESAASAAN